MPSTGILDMITSNFFISSSAVSAVRANSWRSLEEGDAGMAEATSDWTPLVLLSQFPARKILMANTRTFPGSL